MGKLEQISVKIFETFDDSSFRDLMSVAPSAFLEKYKGTLFIRFDEPYVKWMLAEKESIYVVAYTHDGRPCGGVIGIKRKLKCGQKVFNTLYVTLLGVPKAFHGNGIARSLVEALKGHSLSNPDDAFFMSFATDSFGIHAFESLVRRYPSLEMWVSDTLPIHVAAYDVQKVHEYFPLPSIARMRPLKSLIEFDQSIIDKLGARTTSIPQTLFNSDCEQDSLAFLRTENSWPLMYSNGTDARTFRVEFGKNSWCEISWKMGHYSVGDKEPVRIATIQRVDRSGVNSLQIGFALREANLMLKSKGCVAALWIDSAHLPRLSLLMAQFFKTPVAMLVSVVAMKSSWKMSKKDLKSFAVDVL